MSKVFSLADEVDNFCITMNTSVYCAFFVHFPDKVLKFRKLPNSLCRLDPECDTNVLSLEECEKFFGAENKTQLTNIVEDNL